MTCIGAQVPCHQQDTDVYCGPATAQMILAGLNGQVYTQPDLVAAGLSNADLNGGTPPSALRRVLNAFSNGATFNDYCDPTADAGCQRIVTALQAEPIGVAALVKGGTHWVVVTGAQVDGDAAQGPPFTIGGFYVNDPEPQTAAMLYAADPTAGIETPPMPHALNDHCGHGDAYGASVYIAIGEWLTSYWNEASQIENKQGFITVAAGEPAEAEAEHFVLFAEAIVYGPDRREAAAKQAARKGISRHNIATEGPLADVLGSYELGDVSLHTELSHPPRHSFQIKLMRGRVHVGTAAVDAETEEFLGVQIPGNVLPTGAEMRELALSALTRQAMMLGDVLGPIDLAQELFTVHPTLVWRACRQSMSRYYPFVQVNLAGTTLYVGLDGRVHRRLTPHDNE